MTPALLIDPRDNLAVALQDLKKGARVEVDGQSITLQDDIAAKHKFTTEALRQGDRATMYGVTVGAATHDIEKGGLIHTENLEHLADDYDVAGVKADTQWDIPDVSSWKSHSFDGYHRAGGSVGTANHWLVVPLVFCETRNIKVMREAFERALGYEKSSRYEGYVNQLIAALQNGASVDDLRALPLIEQEHDPRSSLFPHIDGIKFLTHHMGCGGTRDDSRDLCGLLAGYITHPNVAGVTVLSLGCEIAQFSLLQEEISERDPNFSKPLHFFRQQDYPSESVMLEGAIRETFASLVEVNANSRREPAPLHKLTIGVECGGSDGFSGISANPVIGAVSDRCVALGGKVILSEFPELCGVEQELLNRCQNRDTAKRFAELTSRYADLARMLGSDFSHNPSPGNIKDGLITDAIKSAGAAKKGGSSPIVAALDYPEMTRLPGLNLLCTPGGDVESTTAMAGSHANVILFSTGLGTPTGNPICPVLKISSNSELASRLPDMIDFDTGSVIRGEKTIPQLADELLTDIVEVASGRKKVKAQILGQDDFLPWKRGVSL